MRPCACACFANMEVPRGSVRSTSWDSALLQRVPPLLTDLYHFTMAYGYWKCGRHNEEAVFELFFRDLPFGGGFSLFCGLQDCLHFIRNFRIKPEDVTYLKSVMPSTIDEGFFDFLREVDPSSVSITAIPEGSVVFPKVPLMEVRGPLPVVQLLETSLLCMVNYASLVSTNAARFCLAAGSNKKLLEFGLRRAQGPDGGLSASRYSYIGGFHGSSNVLAGKYFNIPVVGTMAHSFITSFSSLKEVHPSTLISEHGEGPPVDLVKLSVFWLNRVCSHLHMIPEEANKGELAAFISYAIAFPRNFLALLDTYSVIRSGAVNFCTVALALCQLHYQPVGVRLDSGDLCRQSVDLRRIFHSCSTEFQVPGFKSLVIIGSNSISEQSVMEMKEQENEIDIIAVGTNLVTCPLQPSLGHVYKLVQVNGKPRMKFSEDPEKTTLPGRKAVYRLYNNDGHPFLDLMTLKEEPVPTEGQDVHCCMLGGQMETVKAARVELLLQEFFSLGQPTQPFLSATEIRNRVQTSLIHLNPGLKRLQQPDRYKVAVSERFASLLKDLKNRKDWTE
ncbi:nicotinate phosphoribosyltransferase [Erpetoichthys calabaricus]|nr:nicotinate phosphoribosyltransferase [Erpetoichthys calabaricus]